MDNMVVVVGKKMSIKLFLTFLSVILSEIAKPAKSCEPSQTGEN